MQVLASPSQLRMAEWLASLSLLMDLGSGKPLEWVLCAFWLGVRLLQRLEMSEAEARVIMSRP